MDALSYIKSAQVLLEKAEAELAPAALLTLSNLTATPPTGSVFDVTVDCSPDIVNATIYDSVTNQKAAPDTIPVDGVASWPALTGLAAGVHQLKVQGWNVPAGQQGGSTPVLSITVTVPAPTPPPTPTDPMPIGVPGTWKLTFQDDFDGTSLDTAVWGDSGYTNNNMSQGANPVNVSVANSIATLVNQGPGTGAQIASIEQPAAIGDYVEWRAYFTKYNWCAVWTSGSNWPENGEDDINEYGYTYNTHWLGSDGQDEQSNSVTVPGSWTDGWHTYGCLRGQDEITFYWDGKIVGTVPRHDQGGPHNLIATNGSGDTPLAGYDGRLDVDYVRVWSPVS